MLGSDDESRAKEQAEEGSEWSPTPRANAMLALATTVVGVAGVLLHSAILVLGYMLLLFLGITLNRRYFRLLRAIILVSLFSAGAWLLWWLFLPGKPLHAWIQN